MSVTSDRSEILVEISAVEQKLSELKAETRLAEEKLNSLKHTLQNLEGFQSVGTDPSTPDSSHPHHTAEEKVALFRSLFRGRNDVYPRMWINSKTGKKGYSPACDNEWVRGICDKPRIKCGDCPNQSFVDVTTKTLLDYLKGLHVIGV